MRNAECGMRNGPGHPQAEALPDALETPPMGETTPVLERLGPSPFPRSGFPLMGFLATLYDHVAEFARERLDDPSEPRGLPPRPS